MDLSHLTPTERRAYVLMDNQPALGAEWYPDMLAMELGGLRDEVGGGISRLLNGGASCPARGHALQPARPAIRIPMLGITTGTGQPHPRNHAATDPAAGMKPQMPP